MSVKRLLVMDKSRYLGDALALALADYGYNVLSVPSVVNFTYLSQYEPNVVLANVRIARINDGAFLEFCAQVRGFHPAIIVMDADPHEKSALKRQGVAGFLTLPFYVDDLVACVEHCQAGQGHR